MKFHRFEQNVSECWISVDKNKAKVLKAHYLLLKYVWIFNLESNSLYTCATTSNSIKTVYFFISLSQMKISSLPHIFNSKSKYMAGKCAFFLNIDLQWKHSHNSMRFHSTKYNTFGMKSNTMQNNTVAEKRAIDWFFANASLALFAPYAQFSLCKCTFDVSFDIVLSMCPK